MAFTSVSSFCENHFVFPDWQLILLCCSVIFLKILFLYICIWWVHCRCLQTHQKRASDPIADGCEPPCGCWELNSGPLEDQSVLLTTEPSLQPPLISYTNSMSEIPCFFVVCCCVLSEADYYGQRPQKLYAKKKPLMYQTKGPIQD